LKKQHLQIGKTPPTPELKTQHPAEHPGRPGSFSATGDTSIKKKLKVRQSATPPAEPFQQPTVSAAE